MIVIPVFFLGGGRVADLGIKVNIDDNSGRNFLIVPLKHML